MTFTPDQSGPFCSREAEFKSVDCAQVKCSKLDHISPINLCWYIFGCSLFWWCVDLKSRIYSQWSHSALLLTRCCGNTQVALVEKRGFYTRKETSRTADSGLNLGNIRRGRDVLTHPGTRLKVLVRTMRTLIWPLKSQDKYIFRRKKVQWSASVRYICFVSST